VDTSFHHAKAFGNKIRVDTWTFQLFNSETNKDIPLRFSSFVGDSEGSLGFKGRCSILKTKGTRALTVKNSVKNRCIEALWS
jgi:hypothetical protein